MKIKNNSQSIRLILGFPLMTIVHCTLLLRNSTHPKKCTDCVLEIYITNLYAIQRLEHLIDTVQGNDKFSSYNDKREKPVG